MLRDINCHPCPEIRQSGAEALPATGSTSKAVIAVGVALLLLGAAMWFTARRSSTR